MNFEEFYKNFRSSFEIFSNKEEIAKIAWEAAVKETKSACVEAIERMAKERYKMKWFGHQDAIDAINETKVG